MTEAAEAIRIHRGLKGVYFDRSPCTFLDGELPTRTELARFEAELKAARTLPEAIYDIVRAVRTAHPMDVLRTAVSALAAFDPETADTSREATLRKGVRLTAQVPMIVAAHDRIRQGREPVRPDPALGHAANLLWMLTGATPGED